MVQILPDFSTLQPELLLYQISQYLPAQELLNLLLTSKATLKALKLARLSLIDPIASLQTEFLILSEWRFVTDLCPKLTILRLKGGLKLAVHHLLVVNRYPVDYLTITLYHKSGYLETIKTKPELNVLLKLGLEFKLGRLLNLQVCSANRANRYFDFQRGRAYTGQVGLTCLNRLKGYYPLGLWLDQAILQYADGQGNNYPVGWVLSWGQLLRPSTEKPGFLGPISRYRLELVTGQVIDYHYNRTQALLLDGQPVATPLTINGLVFDQYGVSLAKEGEPEQVLASLIHDGKYRGSSIPDTELGPSLSVLQQHFQLKLGLGLLSSGKREGYRQIL